MHVPFDILQGFIQFLKNSSEHYIVGMQSVLQSLISCTLQLQQDNLMFSWPCIMNWLYINYQLLYTDCYLFIKY